MSVIPNNDVHACTTGGKSPSGTCCTSDGYECVYGNKWYYQCKECFTCCKPNQFRKGGTCYAMGTEVASPPPPPPPIPSPPPPPSSGTPTSSPSSSSSSEAIGAEKTHIHATMWAPQSDSGGCSMPYTSYAIQHALALGDEHNLGGLAISNAMCGQVLEIQCKSTATSNKVTRIDA